MTAHTGFDVQALALRLLTHLSRPAEAALVQKLAAYVAQQDISKRSSIETPALSAPSPWVRRWTLFRIAQAAALNLSSCRHACTFFLLPSAWAQAVALMVQALAAYDIAAGSSVPDLRLLAAVDQMSVLEVGFLGSCLQISLLLT